LLQWHRYERFRSLTAGGPFETVTREIPGPSRYEVRIRVQACGICHSDSLTKLGHWPGIAYPRVPGHEIVGIVDALGPDAKPWTLGQSVGVGWFGGCCSTATPAGEATSSTASTAASRG
jgi:D-arabinose 1-dehydrogenase-like Zn-dependent alcohol dehydrogenase